MTIQTRKVLTDKDRYEYLCNYYHKQLSRDDKYELNRPNFNFLIIGYNKYLKVKDENTKLKLQIKLLEMGQKV